MGKNRVSLVISNGRILGRPRHVDQAAASNIPLGVDRYVGLRYKFEANVSNETDIVRGSEFDGKVTDVFPKQQAIM